MKNGTAIAVGTSAGGISALQRLVAGLPRDLPAAVLVVQHLAASAIESALSSILRSHTDLEVAFGEDGQPAKAGNIYLAPPNHHMLLTDGHIALSKGPRENLMRPAIDPLFRSAALNHSTNVIGVVLTGTGDDGASGLLAIKLNGGKTIVQDPTDAEWPEMPRNAMQAVGEPDLVLPISGIAAAIADFAAKANGGGRVKDPTLEREVQMALESPIGRPFPVGESAGISCPECGGPLYKVPDGVDRYRCRIGHALTDKTLETEQGRIAELSLWAAVRTLEERAETLERMAGRLGGSTTAERFRDRATESRRHAANLRELIDKF